MRRTPDIYGGADPRDLPAYTIRDAARIVGVANQTLRNWVYGRDFPSRTGRRTSAAVIHTPEPGLLSFTNLIEAHVLASLRRHRVKLERIRSAVRYVERQLKLKHALAQKVFQTDGVNLFIWHLSQDGKYVPLNASQDGQAGLRAVLDAHLRRVEYEQGRAVRFYPLVTETKSIVVDPRRAFGRPTLVGTSVPVVDITSRWLSGEKINVLARDYAVTPDLIEEVCRAAPRKAA